MCIRDSYNGASLNGNIDFGGNFTSSGAVNVTGGITTVGGVNTNTLTATQTGTSITATGDIKYNGSTSLTSQMATLNGYKTSGTFASTTTFQNLYAMSYTPGSRGIITVVGQSGGPNYGMISAFFEGTSAQSYASITQIACSGNNAQAAINPTNATTGGTQTIFLQMSGSNVIQVKTSAAFNVNWFVTLL